MSEGRATKVKRRATLALAMLLTVSLLGGGCFLDSEVEPYYGRVQVPRSQEFRWSDGGLPQTFDPALAAAPPDTDAVRAIFEGLTEYDPQTLQAVPGVAERWESSPDAREWTFYLRHDARWSNGDPVKAQDFVSSWERTLRMGERAPHARLMENIAGVEFPKPAKAQPVSEPVASPEPSPQATATPGREAAAQQQPQRLETKPEPSPALFGAEAMSDYVLRVRLQRSDRNFPSLVAHPVFRPVHNSEDETQAAPDAANFITNGAFRLTKAGRDTVVLERAGNYWDAQTVGLERVQFVNTRDAETALAAYRAGEVDAVTNAVFEPLALKLLAPYKDFRRATYGALTYYSFNQAHAPFNDRRVREALAIVIDRDRISEDLMGGATEPAKKFLPVQVNSTEQGAIPLLERDADGARRLLADAGFPNGQNFPRVKLLINRNEQQRQLARTVSDLWRSNLGIETDIVIKNWDDYEEAVRKGDYDIVRRGMVMQTVDETTNMRIMFEPDIVEEPVATVSPDSTATPNATGSASPSPANPAALETMRVPPARMPKPVYTEAEAMQELPAIPIYFASSYSLVKPYVTGFDTNLLDAPTLKRVKINTAWQAQPAASSGLLR
ncbi:MAG TPA: peptide ABC transporter substrate-binding protein [Pyrinomonadaceae bacterium]|nr:peptide ABC transporter substrate-binding protein [Pyrinomonadaceae bacterium]